MSDRNTSFNPFQVLSHSINVKQNLAEEIAFYNKKGGLRLRVFSEVAPKTNDGEPKLTVLSDADMAGDIDGRRSPSGVLVFLGAAPIAW